MVNFGHGAVESNDVHAVVGRIEDEVLAHDSQANEAEISSSNIVSRLSVVGDAREPARGPADIYAGKAHTEL